MRDLLSQSSLGYSSQGWRRLESITAAGTIRLGDEERRLMNLVPAPAVRKESIGELAVSSLWSQLTK